MRSILALLTLLFVLPAGAITRDDVIDTAAGYCFHEWYCDTDNLSVDASCSATWSSDYSVGWWTGLPYDWGGYMTVAEYDSQLASGYGAGSHSWHGILWCTSGVDCSGFVSKTWDAGHYTTSSLDNISSSVSQASIERGDAVNDPGSHVVLFTHVTNAGGVVFYEASGGACKVRLYAPSSGWSYLSGYTPARYDSISNGTARGTATNPIGVNSFPYETFDATAGTGSDVWDSYACSPSTDESGPERIYRLSLGSSGTLTATVTDDSGTDIDVHLLGSADPGDCLQRDDVSVSQEVESGTYYLALDTWTNGSGTEYPGAYNLLVEFTGEAGDDDDDHVGDDDDHVGDDDDHVGDDDDTGGVADDDDHGDDDDTGPQSEHPQPRVNAAYEEAPGCECPLGRPGKPYEAILVLLLGTSGLGARRLRR